jgi:nitrogenase subunit NifH
MVVKDLVLHTLHKQVEAAVELVKLVLLLQTEILAKVETDQLIQLVELQSFTQVEAAVEPAQVQVQVLAELVAVEMELLVAVELQEDKMEPMVWVVDLVDLPMMEHILMHQAETVLYF